MTKSPQWLTTYVESLDIQPLTKYRSDCPVCGKSNTFSVTDDGVQRMWYCFHADCNVKGRTGVKLTKSLQRTHLYESCKADEVADNAFQPPHTFVSCPAIGMQSCMCGVSSTMRILPVALTSATTFSDIVWCTWSMMASAWSMRWGVP